MRHCNGCGLDLDDTSFIRTATRCKRCVSKRRGTRQCELLGDDLLKMQFEAAVERTRGDLPAERIVRKGVPTAPGVREARGRLYRALTEMGWPMTTIALFASVSVQTVARHV